MRFDETGVIKGVPRKLIRNASTVLHRATDLSEIITRWICTPDREITICNGVDGFNHFESLCLVLKHNGKHIAERYLSLTTITQQRVELPRVSSFVNWNGYFQSNPTLNPDHILPHFNRAGFYEAVKRESRITSKHLGVDVINFNLGMRIALAFGLSPYCEATISGFNHSYFEEDKAALKTWGKKQLLWLFTSLRPPHPVAGQYPEVVESCVINLSLGIPKRIRSKAHPLLIQ